MIAKIEDLLQKFEPKMPELFPEVLVPLVIIFSPLFAISNTLYNLWSLLKN